LINRQVILDPSRNHIIHSQVQHLSSGTCAANMDPFADLANLYIRMRKYLTISACTIVLASCHSSKHIQQTVITVDSSAVKTLERKLDEATSRYRHAESQLREQQYAGVQFDTIPVHDTVPGKCPENTVWILPDGGIQAKGNIKSAFTSKDKFLSTISDLRDSLHRSQQDLAAEKRNVKIEYKEKEVQVKTRSWWWIWILVGMAIMGAIWRFKNQLIRLNPFKFFNIKL